MNDQASAPSERDKQIAARRKKVKALTPQTERVRVTPASDTIRKAIKHPNNIPFPESGSVEWPLDSFTRRRIADGTVTREERQDRREDRRTRSTAAKAE